MDTGVMSRRYRAPSPLAPSGGGHPAPARGAPRRAIQDSIPISPKGIRPTDINGPRPTGTTVLINHNSVWSLWPSGYNSRVLTAGPVSIPTAS